MSYYIKKLVKKIKKIFRKQNKPILNNPKPDDVWLVSFPKAGNTWMNFLLANLMVKHCGKDIDVNFKTIYSVVPDIHYNKKEILDDLGFAPFPRIIKSHSAYLPDYKRVVYIIRDPRDVMVSYYHYLMNKIDGPKFKNFSQFIKSKNYGIPAMLNHIKSWLNKWDIIIKYEDLKKAPLNQMRNILSYLGVNTNDDNINFAVEKSSFENMRLMEKRDGMVKSHRFKKEFAFMRKGQVGGWNELFNENDLQYYEKQSENYKLSSFLKEHNYL